MTAHEPPIDRRGTSSLKWEKYSGRDVLPLWVADMDLPTAPFVVDAVRERLGHPILGYTDVPRELGAAFIGWLERNYRWQVDEEWLVWLPGVVPGFNLAARAYASVGRELVIPAPVYGPILDVPAQTGLDGVISRLVRNDGRWEMDFNDLGTKIGGATAAVLFCNPQNPTGRVYDRAELEALAELVVDADAAVISDEIHCPIILDPDKRHVAIARLDPAIESRSISLFAPTKAYNFPGLSAAVAVIPHAETRQRFEDAAAGLMPSYSPLAFAAVTAAFEDRSSWLAEQNRYLADNAALLEQAVAGLEGVETTRVEGTYLAWLDVSELGLDDPAATFERYGLGLHAGEEFGGPGFLRFNFGCARSMLNAALDRLIHAVHELQGSP